MADETVSFKHTLNLPRTDFPIRANAKVEDAQLLARWHKEDLSRATFLHNQGNRKYILHDGPPYANGHIHIGHAYNKILKDILTKSRRMAGMHVPVTPGWDCHGLPIELKVTKENAGLSPDQLKRACRDYATTWIDIQRQEFKKLGVLMDWDRPYLTMNFAYEAQELRAFADLVSQGYITKKNKTVPWCPVDQTVLATAEIEYQERKDPSIYVLFALDKRSAEKIAPDHADQEINLLVWTTTPWTLPLNRAVLLHPTAEYVILDIKGTLIIVADQLADKISAMLGVEKKVVATIPAQQFRGGFVHHPFIQDFIVPILLEQFVSLDDGTACVHCAPGCGPEDYDIGVRNKLEIFSPISPAGTYTGDVRPQELIDMPVSQGQIWVLKTLQERGRLLHKTSISHPYPHCWRCHYGLIYRATSQWFCDLSQGNLKKRALEAIEHINFVPSRSINFLKATIGNRLEWCLSRQRVWGVPIPALLCNGCQHPFTSVALIHKVADKVQQEGIEYWDKVQVDQLVDDSFACVRCNGKTWVKEKDILDVWFDSGISHFAVLLQNPDLAFAADAYLEGVDQHRGWFQSSLLTSLALEQVACTKSIITHGFTVDQNGQKMSKSIGNVVSPQDVIDQYGTDGLRLWASSNDLEGDAVISDVLLQNVAQVHRKVRNTCRFLISNLYDFDIKEHAVAYEQLFLIDTYALHQLTQVNKRIRDAYDDIAFTAVFHELGDYCSSALSSLYLDIIKDRLYVQKADSIERRSAQTACWYILDTLTRLMAPILSFTAEHVSDFYQKDKKVSIHLQSFADPEPFWHKSTWDDQWLELHKIRSALLKAIELKREQGLIKQSLEAQITLYVDQSVERLAFWPRFMQEISRSRQTAQAFFKEFLIVSAVTIVPGPDGLDAAEYPGLYVRVDHADGDKCPRCWHWQVTDHQHHLCYRCQKIV